MKELEILAKELILNQYYEDIKRKVNANEVVSILDYKLAKIAKKAANTFECSHHFVGKARTLMITRQNEVKDIHKKVTDAIHDVFFLRISTSDSYYSDSDIIQDYFLDDK